MAPPGGHVAVNAINVRNGFFVHWLNRTQLAE